MMYGTEPNAEPSPAAAGEFVIARIKSGYTSAEALVPSVETTCPLHNNM